MKRNIPINNQAFSLLEMTVVIIIMTILASVAIPVISRGYLEKVGNKTALDMGAIQEAARAYYIDHNKWPDNDPSAIGVLEANNYLPSSWKGINPFGINVTDPSLYNYQTSSTDATFTVFTYVPLNAQPIIQNLLPTNWVSGNNIYSSVPVPGVSTLLPTGTILAWASQNLPAGFLWCNGQLVNIVDYHGLYAILGTNYGGNGISTFGLPDLMGRVIVGIDAMGGAMPKSRISQWSLSPATMGGTFGEDAHRQSLSEMAPHAHTFTAYINGVKGFSGNSTTAPRDNPSGGTTSPAGGNGDGSGLGAPSNVVQPSMAMGYIIKY